MGLLFLCYHLSPVFKFFMKFPVDSMVTIDELAGPLVSGSYLDNELVPGQRAKFDAAFNFVDGVSYPLSLLHPDIPQKPGQAKMIGNERIQSRLKNWMVPLDEFNREVVGGDLRLQYIDDRKFHGGVRTSYLDSFGLGIDDFTKLMGQLSANFGNRALAVLDAGCGIGNGFDQLLQLDGIDKEISVGLTLPRHTNWHSLDPRLLYVNIMHCGQRRLFDVGFDAYGAFSYHPMNSYHRSHGKLSLLHLVNLIRPGGIIFSADIDPFAANILLENGVLENVGLGNGVLGKVFRVVRQPTANEVLKYVMV